MFIVHHLWVWLPIAAAMATLVVAFAFVMNRRMFAGAFHFVHDDGTVLRVDGPVTTEGQRTAILSYSERFAADPLDPAIEKGLRELGFRATYIGRPGPRNATDLDR